MSTTTHYQDYWINPRIKVAALWASTLFIFAYVDLFSLYRADVRADLESGEIFAFTIGGGFLLGVTAYIVVPSLMLSLSLVLPVRATRMANIAVAAVYAVTIVGGAIGEWSYYVLGSLFEAALLVGVVYYAWTWPRATDAVPPAQDQAAALHTSRGSAHRVS